MLRGLRIAALTCLAALPTIAGTVPAHADAEYLRLRPAKEPACPTGKRGKCPLVAAPRIDTRRTSTIPGIQNPDFGRPPVIVIEPSRPRGGAPFRSFGAHRGIFGN